MKKVYIVGAGISGCVLAERFARDLGVPVVLLEGRAVIGGNSRAEFDEETGIEKHLHGSHIFHTKDRRVWDYIRTFTDFTTYRHKVMLRSGGRVYSMPINLKTINDLYGTEMTPDEAQAFLAERIARERVPHPSNLEEKAVSLVGRALYETTVRDYTAKQWGRDPRELPESIINRLPVRYNYNSDYFDTPMQGIPAEGFGAMFERLVAHPNIEVRLRTDFFSVRSQIPPDAIVLYTGMIDRLFDNCFGALEWRSLRFEWETVPTRDFQGTSVVNYADPAIPYTRIHEFKHYNPERTEPFELGKTVICREYPKTWVPGDEAYYPVNSAANHRKLEQYRAECAKQRNLFVGGRLGAYQYWDMDRAIGEALSLYETIKERMVSC